MSQDSLLGRVSSKSEAYTYDLPKIRYFPSFPMTEISLTLSNYSSIMFRTQTDSNSVSVGNGKCIVFGVGRPKESSSLCDLC